MGAPTTPPKDGKAPQTAKGQEMPPPTWLPTSKAVLVKTRPRPAPIKQMPQVKGGAPPKIQALWPDIAPEPNISASGAARILAMTPYCQGPPPKAMPPSPFPKPVPKKARPRPQPDPKISSSASSSERTGHLPVPPAVPSSASSSDWKDHLPMPPAVPPRRRLPVPPPPNQF